MKASHSGLRAPMSVSVYVCVCVCLSVSCFHCGSAHCPLAGLRANLHSLQEEPCATWVERGTGL